MEAPLVIAANMLAQRKAKGLTQAQVADALGVTKGAVSRWESGENFPRVDKLLAVAALYECDVRDFFKGLEA